ncbi:DUF6531 domain-containing protein [Gandjariella thermophila]|uniref:DUF6531 domain-containing protein n=1 Tax=Gandjariella thermophila TaxID=1931992 RepID=UPI0010F4B86E|nr:DUF6531 domain-containing protein [Gandjariella thermophila]
MGAAPWLTHVQVIRRTRHSAGRAGRRGWRLWARTTAWLIVVAVAMTAGAGQADAWASTVAGTPSTPQQRSGSAAGLPHTAKSAINKHAKSAAKPGTVPGAAPEAKTPTPAVTPQASNVAQHGEAQSAAARTRSAPPTPGKELVDQRNATRKVFANPDGTLTARVYPRPVHYQTSTGTWADIDTTLVRGSDGAWREKADAPSASFAAAGDASSLVGLELDASTSLGFGVQGASATPGVASGSTITYPGIQPHADATYLTTATGVKETLVLHDASAPTTWVFPLTLRGLTASMGPGGSVQLTDTQGHVRDVIASGFMEDAKIDPRSGDGTMSTGVTYGLTTVNGRPALQVDLDEAWLHDPARVFPVKVDPSVADLNTSSSTYVMSPFTANYSSDSELKVGTYDGGSNIANSYLNFNVGSLTNDYIEAVTLNLDEIWSYSCQARPFYVSPITSGWNVYSINTYPGLTYGGPIGVTNTAVGYSSGCPGPAWVSVDLGDNPSAAGTRLLESWTHGGPNLGLAVTADTRDSYAWKRFDSVNSPYPPYLSITYSPYGAAYSFPNNYVEPTSTASGSQQVTITNLGNNAWTPGNQSLWYQLYDLNWNNLRISGSVDPPTALPFTVNPNQTVTMTGNIGPVSPGQYYLCWDMFNGSTSFNLTYGVDSPCELINSANTPPQIDSQQPLSNTVLGSLTPQLYVTGHDPDNYPNRGLTYDFQVYTAPTDGSTPALVVDSGWISSTTWTVPSGKLVWNQSYSWTVANNDTLGSSPSSAPSYFTTAVQQPLITSHLGAAAVNTSGRNFDPGVGDYTTAVTDANVAGVGPALSIVRSYNSQDPRTANLFGAGWSTAYDMAATPDNDGSGNVVVTYPDGHTVRFGLNVDGTTFTPPQGTYATFQPITGGGYTLTDRGGTAYTFARQVGTTWKLTKITDADGRSETLTYAGDGTLSTIINTASNRSLHLSWGGGHVTQVATDAVTTGGSPLTWTYTYSGDSLAQVCPPTSSTACTDYTLTSGTNSGSHYRSAVLDAGPYAYWRFGDSSGTTATDEIAANLGTKNGTYTNVSLGGAAPLPGSPTTSGYFNGSSSSVRLPDQLVSSTTYLGVQLRFQTTLNGPGGILFSTGHSTIGASNPDSGAMPVLYVGSDGKLYGQFWNGSVQPLVSANRVNDAAWHQVTIVGSGTSQSLYLDGQLIGSKSGQLYNFDPLNFVGAGLFNGNAWVNPPASGWSYFNGNIAEVAFYTKPLGGPVISQQYTVGTRAATEITSITPRPVPPKHRSPTTAPKTGRPRSPTSMAAPGRSILRPRRAPPRSTAALCWPPIPKTSGASASRAARKRSTTCPPPTRPDTNGPTAPPRTTTSPWDSPDRSRTCRTPPPDSTATAVPMSPSPAARTIPVRSHCGSKPLPRVACSPATKTRRSAQHRTTTNQPSTSATTAVCTEKYTTITSARWHPRARSPTASGTSSCSPSTTTPPPTPRKACTSTAPKLPPGAPRGRASSGTSTSAPAMSPPTGQLLPLTPKAISPAPSQPPRSTNRSLIRPPWTLPRSPRCTRLPRSPPPAPSPSPLSRSPTPATPRGRTPTNRATGDA